MTILEAIVQADRVRRNELQPELKLQWLSALDGQIHRELLTRHRGETVPFEGYGPDTDTASTRLLAPFPYDELYPRYLVMRVDLEQGELERYNNDAALFNRLWQSFAGDYVHTHLPTGADRLRF